MYWHPPSEEELAPLGLRPSDYDIEAAEVWPECWDAVALFSRLGTQWFIGPSGRTGLRYEAVYPLLDRRCPDPDDWAMTFADLQTLEAAALEAMHTDD